MLSEQQKAFARILDLVEEAGCMPHLVLVGSWAEFVYKEAGMLPGFDPNIRTRDVDFLVRNLRKPNPPAGLAGIARERGYFVESDRVTGTTKILDVSGLEVEFLIGKRGAGVEPSLKTNIGVTAQALRHLDMLSSNTTAVLCLGHLVHVPIPEAYAVHKMVINEERGTKAEKDMAAVSSITPFLDRAIVEELLGRLSKKERMRAIRFMEAAGFE